MAGSASEMNVSQLLQASVVMQAEESYGKSVLTITKDRW